MILLWRRRVKRQARKCQARGNQCSSMGIPPMALEKGPTTIHKRGYIPRRSMMPPMHQRRHLDRRVPPMMCTRAAVAMMVVTIVVGGLYGRTPHNCRGHSPRMMPGKNGHTVGVGHSGGHAPQRSEMARRADNATSMPTGLG